MVSGRIKILKDVFLNVFSNEEYKFSYVVETANWSIKQDGYYIASFLNKKRLLKSRVTTTCLGLRDQIIHFGSVNTFLQKSNFKKCHKSNRLLLTWFHTIPEDNRNNLIKTAQRDLAFIHTSCNFTRKSLIDLGVDPGKIIVIPLGVDLNLFSPTSLEEKQKIKREIGISLNRVIIGSFQKDGIGWGRGEKPKLIKGPDVFIKVVERLARDNSVFVLLVGPARGYVENELKRKKIAFKNIGYLSDFKKLAYYYKALDLYLITSRIEGGPKQILEAWASGVPVVSTKVGMVPDISEHKKNILLAEIGDIETIVNNTEKIIRDEGLRRDIVKNGLLAVKNYSWENIAERYYKEVYAKL